MKKPTRAQAIKILDKATDRGDFDDWWMELMEEFGDVLERTLNDLLSAAVKEQDAPASAELHLAAAISRLHKALPDYAPHNDEHSLAINSARALVGYAYDAL